MMKRTTATKVNLALSLDDFIVNMSPVEDDCFTHEWDPISKDCKSCADFNLCGSLYRKLNLSKKVADVEAKNNTFLDVVNFDDIDRDLLYENIISGTTTTNEVYEDVKEISGCDSEVILTEWLKVFMAEYNLKSKKGIMYGK